MTLISSKNPYSQMLATVEPTAIESEAEYERILAIVEELHCNENLSSDQLKLYKLLVTIIEAYEEEHYPMGDPSPLQMLEFLMESREMSADSLIDVMGSREVVNGVLSGQREIDAVQAKALGDYFHVSPTVFL